jgi:hypothetical protein
MISPFLRIFGSALLGCLLVLNVAGQSTDTKKTSEKAAATPSQPLNTAGLVTAAQLTQWMEKNGRPRGTTATINQWEFAMNKLIPGGWHSYGVNFLNPAYQGKADPTKYTADQFLEGLRKYEAERNQGKTKK